MEDGSTADQTAAEIKIAYESNANTNAFDDAASTKLTGIEANATADQIAIEVPYTPTLPLIATNVQNAIEETVQSVDVHTDVDLTAIQLGDRLEWDGAKFIPVNVQEFNYFFNPVTTSTSVTFLNVLTAADTYIGGTYSIAVTYLWNHDAIGNDFEGRITFDGVVLFDIGAGISHKEEPKDSAGNTGGTGSGQQLAFGAATILTVIAGSRILSVDFRTDSGGTASSIWNVFVKISKI